MRPIRFLAPAIIAAGFGIGWIAAPPLDYEGVRSADARYDVRHGGEEMGAALRILRETAEPESAQNVAPTPIDIAPPPPIDIAEHFRRELTALEDRPEGLALWFVDDTALTRRRLLHRGDFYRDGWRIASIDRREVVLRRRREERVLRIVDVVPDAVLSASDTLEGQSLLGPNAAAMPPEDAAQTRRQVRRPAAPGGM